MISIIIATKNRPHDIKRALISLVNCKFSNFEIIVSDQSNNSNTYDNIKNIKSDNIVYLPLNSSGKSKALNSAIKIAKGDILAFTDDDCLVDKKWLYEIDKVFTRQNKTSAVFGSTYPYKPKHHKGTTCPSTFTTHNNYYVTKPTPHFNYIGFGNNMAIRKSILSKLGGFKEWLSPGSIGSNAEDAEIALRILINNFKIYHNSKMIIFHNRWLSDAEMFIQSLSYVCGEMVCYGYFMFQGYKFANPIIKSNLKDSYYKIRKLAKKILLLKWNLILLTELYATFTEIAYRIRGLVTARYYSISDPLKLK